MTPRQWLGFSPDVLRVLRVDVSVVLLTTAFTALTNPFNGLILRRELGASPFQLAMIGSGSAACLLLSLALTRLIDTRRPLPWAVWSTFTARALFLLVPFITTPWPFVGILIGTNLLGTIAGPAQAAVVQQVYPQAERGRALGAVRVVGAILATAIALVAGKLLGWLSYRWVFCVAALLGMCASLRLRHLPVPAVPVGDAEPRRTRLAEAWRAVRYDERFRHVLVGSFVFGSGVWVMMPATPIMLADVLHASTAQVGLLSAAAGLAALVGNVLWGRLVDRRSSLVALRGVYVIGALTPLIYYASRTPWMLVAASVSESLMVTGLDLVWMLVIIDLAGPGRAAQYAAIGATLAGVRGVIGPLVGGALIEMAGVHAVYLVAAVLMSGGALMVTLQLRRYVTAGPGVLPAASYAR